MRSALSFRGRSDKGPLTLRQPQPPTIPSPAPRPRISHSWIYPLLFRPSLPPQSLSSTPKVIPPQARRPFALARPLRSARAEPQVRLPSPRVWRPSGPVSADPAVRVEPSGPARPVRVVRLQNTKHLRIRRPIQPEPLPARPVQEPIPSGMYRDETHRANFEPLPINTDWANEGMTNVARCHQIGEWISNCSKPAPVSLNVPLSVAVLDRSMPWVEQSTISGLDWSYGTATTLNITSNPVFEDDITTCSKQSDKSTDTAMTGSTNSSWQRCLEEIRREVDEVLAVCKDNWRNALPRATGLCQRALDYSINFKWYHDFLSYKPENRRRKSGGSEHLHQKHQEYPKAARLSEVQKQWRQKNETLG
ncbi:unnamed protein product [Zymoseptoria tritici ST99CH_1A5]|uniref:Uncharacterized protein n=1 Tax=Zymoseptoria tritici ST99CH_1A5 TaxID=1276529 RepID=A0A1Y6LHF4_ZYMTR|nr:unnamed protein product [Zymoseptoria tritici ST99CH_1A5]